MLIKNKLLNNIHIWSLDVIQANYSKYLKYFDLFSREEKEKFHSFKFHDDKTRLLVSHAALRLIIMRYTGLPLALIKFKYNKFNKPYIQHSNDHVLFFNISHSKDKALVAINNSEVGVDIEYIDKSIKINEMVQQIFSQEELREYHCLEHYSDKIDYFYTIWTKKESYLKALSVGLIDDLETINVTANKSSFIQNKTKYFVEALDYRDSNYAVAISYASDFRKNIFFHQNIY